MRCPNTNEKFVEKHEIWPSARASTAKSREFQPGSDFLQVGLRLVMENLCLLVQYLLTFTNSMIISVVLHNISTIRANKRMTMFFYCCDHDGDVAPACFEPVDGGSVISLVEGLS